MFEKAPEDGIAVIFCCCDVARLQHQLYLIPKHWIHQSAQLWSSTPTDSSTTQLSTSKGQASLWKRDWINHKNKRLV